MRTRVWARLVLTVLFAACGEPKKKTEVRYEVAPVSPMVRGDERLLQMTEKDPASHLRWHSSNPGVASVTLDGRVRAVSPGGAVLTGTDGTGSASVEVEVSHANLHWTTPLALQQRTFVAVDVSGWSFVRTTPDTACNSACPGELFVLTEKGAVVFSMQDVGRLIAGKGDVWFESAGEILRWNYATRGTENTGHHGRLLGRFENGDFLLGVDSAAVRMTSAGVEIFRWPFGQTVSRGLILADDDIVVLSGDEIWSGTRGVTTKLSIESKWVPWAADGKGNLVVNDPPEFNFSLYTPADGLKILHGVYSVLISPDHLVESEGLTAALSVPVATQKDGVNLFLELHSFGSYGQYRSFDVVKRGAAGAQWRWGPSTCTDQPFAVAVREGYAIVTSCDRVARIDDSTLKPAGPWPQPGGDATRSWRRQE